MYNAQDAGIPPEKPKYHDGIYQNLVEINKIFRLRF